MKKTLLILCALLLTTLAASAKIVDCSEKLSNTSSAWTGATGAFSDGVEYYSNDAFGTGRILYQTITGLDNGTYTVSFYAAANLPYIDNTSYSGSGIAQAFANDVTQDMTVGTLNGGSLIILQSTYLHTITCTVTEGTLTYGIENVADGGQWYCCYAWSLLFSTNEQVELDEGDMAEECVAELSHWIADYTTTSTTEHFVQNTWSTEGDASGMNTPFLEYWIGSGSVLDEATISHYQLTNLPEGYYRVSIDARAFDENSLTDIVEGDMLFTANDVSIDLTMGTHTTYNGVSAEVYGTYELLTQVADAGTLDIGFTIAAGSNCDWLAFKNLNVEYMGEEISYSIGEPVCAANGTYVQPGSEVSITFSDCLSPTTDETPMIAEGKSITVNNNDVEATVTSAGLTATVTFTIPETIEQGTTVTVTVPEGLLTWEKATAVSSPTQETTYTFTTPSMADQMGVYLLSVYEDEFLSRGHDYGTSADVDNYGIPVNIVATEDGSYTIMFVDSYGYMYSDGWAWVDGTETNASHYTITPTTLTDGTTVYQFAGGSGTATDLLYVYDVEKVNNATDTQDTYRVANNGIKNTNYSDDEQTYWQILSMEERDAHKEAFVESQKTEIATAAGATDLDSYISSQTATDLTDFVEDANFNSASTSNTAGWIGSYSYTNEDELYYGTLNSGNSTGSEVYNGFMRLQQTISALPEGVYKIDLSGFYRQGSDAICDNLKEYDLSIACIDANGYEINLQPWASEATSTNGYYPDNKNDAYAACAEGYANELYTYVGSDGDLVITISSPGYIGSEWMYVRHLSLTYYGDEEIEDTESDYNEGDVVEADGYKCTIVGENLIENHSFELGFDGWTTAKVTENEGFVTTISTDNFALRTSTPEDGLRYLVGTKNTGASGEGSLGKVWEIEAGKTYYFSYWVKSLGTDTNGSYLITSVTNVIGNDYNPTTGVEADDAHLLYNFGNGSDAIGTDWQHVEIVFTNGEEGADDCYEYLQIDFRWLNSNWGFDNFSLYEVEAEDEYANDVTWKLANPSFEVDNVVADLSEDGTRESEDDAEGAWAVTSLTGWNLTTTEVDACDLMTAKAKATDNNLGVPSAAADGTYWLYLKKTWGNNAGSASVKQTVTLPAGEYKLSVQSMAIAASATAKLVAGDDDKAIAINATSATTDILKNMEWTTNELTFTVSDDDTKVELGVEFTFPTGAGVGSFLIDNFKLYTAIEEDEYEDKFKETIEWEMTDAMWGTLILPFDATLEDGLTAYSCNDTEDATDEEGNPIIEVALTEVGQSITANTPYVIKCTDDTAVKTHYFEGVPTNNAETYTVGLLTGTLVDLAVAKGAAFTLDGTEYLLQNHDETETDENAGSGVGFYPILEESSEEATLEAYHCYLTYTTSGSQNPVRAFISLPGDAGEETGIVAVEGDAIANDAIYDLAGRRVSKAVKGVYIMNGKKVLVK